MILPASIPYGEEGWVGLWLPVPPSVNRYWQRAGGKTFRTKKANEFRKRARDLVRFGILQQRAVHRVPFDRPCEIEIVFCPPSKASMDLDNILKATLDALQYGSLITDDRLFTRIDLQRGPVMKARAGSYLRVRPIEPIESLPDWTQEILT